MGHVLLSLIVEADHLFLNVADRTRESEIIIGTYEFVSTKLTLRMIEIKL